jgi:hypothetical protein
VLAGELPDSIFAADLWDIVSRRPGTHPDYLDSLRFFASTHPTENLKFLVMVVTERLGGVAGGTLVYRLDIGFGGGKTHNLIATVHAAREGERQADRQPEDFPVAFHSTVEETLYHRIDELCSHFYRLAEVEPDERSGVGYLMAVFRKRLASSFAAFRRSLERRRDLIAAIQRDLAVMVEASQFQQVMSEDEEDDDEVDAAAALDRERRRLLRLRADPQRCQKLEEERLYLLAYITELGQIEQDSKFRGFASRLNDLLDRGHRVIVFTQYFDTLDFIHDQLIAR